MYGRIANDKRFPLKFPGQLNDREWEAMFPCLP